MSELSVRVVQGSHAPVSTSQRKLDGRALVCITYREDGILSFAEAAPLPGFVDDDVEAAERELRALEASDVSTLVSQATTAFDPRSSDPSVGPDSPVGIAARASARLSSRSAKFALECLVLGATALRRGVPLWRLLASKSVAHRLPTSVVVDPTAPDWDKVVVRQLGRGVRTFKIKCGQDAPAELLVARFLAEHPERPSFRLDPNGAWSVDAALHFLQSFPTERLQWVEDPTGDPSEWALLRNRARIAIDEPLARYPEMMLSPDCCDVAILKPMALGGLARSLELARGARAAGHRVCVSHFFDGPAAMSASIALAFAVQSDDVAPGLGPHLALSAYAQDDSPALPFAAAEIQCPT